jgi:SAM-dependent methyltransferase
MFALKQNDREILHDYYDGRLKTYGYDTRSLGWTPGARKIRFGALTGIGKLGGASILDVGCGFGDLYGYIYDKQIKADYTGVDINPDFIKIAREVHPEAKFILADFEEDSIYGDYDWAIAAGIFTIKISNNEEFIKNTLTKMFKKCNKGFAADFLSPIKHVKDDLYWRCPPEEILKFCRTLSKRVVLKADYMKDEYCVYVYKNEMTDERNVYENI